MVYKEIYNLKNDIKEITGIQIASLETDNRHGLKIENGLLFGTTEWFEMIQTGLIHKYTIDGYISKVYQSGHNDFPQFEIDDGQNKTQWMRKGDDTTYKIGKKIKLVYVKQRFKRPSDLSGAFFKCVIKIEIEDIPQ